MNSLILFLFMQFQIGIEIKFPENVPSLFTRYEKDEIHKFFENQYVLKEIEIPEKDIFTFGREKGLDFILKIEFKEYSFLEEENYLSLKGEIKVFDIEKRRIYLKNIERFTYIEDTTRTSFISFFNSLNYSIYSFLSRIIPPYMEVIEVKDDYIILSNPAFPEIIPGTWIKVFDEKGFPVAYLRVEDVVVDRIYAKNLYSEGKIRKGYKAVISFAPSGESGMIFSLSFLKMKADTGSYGSEKNIKPFNTFKYGFNFSLYYRWISLNTIGFNISFYPLSQANLWKLAVEMEKGFKLWKLEVFPGIETGVFLGSQKAENGINTTGVAFFISPLLKTEFQIHKKFTLSILFSYLFSQNLNSFWYEKRGGTEYISDSLLIYKNIELKSPEIRFSLNYKLVPLGF